LFDDYRARLVRHGHQELRRLPYGFGSFSNGERINSVSRRLFGLAMNRFSDSVDPFDARGPVYRMLADQRALGGGAPQEAASSYNAHRHSRAMGLMERLLRLTFRLLGPERYNTLMTYLGYISSMRNQGEVFFPVASDAAPAHQVASQGRR